MPGLSSLLSVIQLAEGDSTCGGISIRAGSSVWGRFILRKVIQPVEGGAACRGRCSLWRAVQPVEGSAICKEYPV